jgi:hypothetical protein
MTFLLCHDMTHPPFKGGCLSRLSRERRKPLTRSGVGVKRVTEDLPGVQSDPFEAELPRGQVARAHIRRVHAWLLEMAARTEAHRGFWR